MYFDYRRRPHTRYMNDTDLQAPQLYINRELSFLEFNQRVLEQAKTPHPPARTGQIPVHLMRQSRRILRDPSRRPQRTLGGRRGARRTGRIAGSGTAEGDSRPRRAPGRRAVSAAERCAHARTRAERHRVRLPRNLDRRPGRLACRLFQPRGRAGAESRWLWIRRGHSRNSQQELEFRDRRRRRGWIRPQQRTSRWCRRRVPCRA